MVKKMIVPNKTNARVLLFSQRNLYEQEVWRSSFLEFENILEQIESVTVLAPKPKKWFNQRRRYATRVGKYSSLIVNPGIPRITPDDHYDIFFAVVEKPSELLNVCAVEGIKDCCDISVCWLTEFYVRQMDLSKSAVKALSKFDYVMFMFDRNEPFKEVIKGEGFYHPPGIDALLFCPYPNPPKRCIDVLSIGRRSEETHKALLNMARRKGIFYVYDTINDLHAHNIEQHRFLNANMAKRSRYFLVYPGKIDSPEETGGQSEFGYRYFEGAASGTIMIGDCPNNKEFEKIFHWPGAVSHLPYGSKNIDTLIEALDNQPEMQESIRKTNIIQSLMHHDWAYRWETVLKIAGLESLNGLVERKRRLRQLCGQIEEMGAIVE